jgi:hypothetical protein
MATKSASGKTSSSAKIGWLSAYVKTKTAACGPGQHFSLQTNGCVAD